ncbi:MAG: hypothetical protein K6346_02560 [Halothiobacillaceae bacterium]
MNPALHCILAALFLTSALGLGLGGCGERPQVLPQGTPEEQAADVRAKLRHVVDVLAAGQARTLMEDGTMFLPAGWRRQQKALTELDALSAQIKGRAGLVIGDVHTAGRWALIDAVSVGGERLGPREEPWFMLYYAGAWRWLPSSIMRDSAVVGVMDHHFDRLYADWKAVRQR